MSAKAVVVSDVPPSAERVLSDTTELGPNVPSAWLDRLLGAMHEAPLDRGRDAIVEHFLDAISPIFPEFALGVCVAGEERRLYLRAQPGAAEGPPDPTRLFPKLRRERVVSIASPPGSSLHVANDDDAPLAEESSEARFFDRVASSLSCALKQEAELTKARAHAGQLRQLQQQVIQAEKLASLGQIAAGVVHELNNPLTSIVVYSDYLRKKSDRAGGDKDDVERLRRIGEAAERILRFSRDLVDYARPSSGVPGTVQIHDVIDQALVFCEHVLTKSGVVVERDFGADVLPVLGIGGELTQVFVNLFTNACHAMPDGGGELRIRTRADDVFVRVEVTDTGHGIETPVLTKIFEPFFTTKVEGMGTGLGLSIVRNIVERHRGTVHAEEPEAGVGARFVVRLPVAQRG